MDGLVLVAMSDNISEVSVEAAEVSIYLYLIALKFVKILKHNFITNSRRSRSYCEIFNAKVNVVFKLFLDNDMLTFNG